MTAFFNYWNAYASESEAADSAKLHWSDASQARGIIRKALAGLITAMEGEQELVEELAAGVVGTARPLHHKGTRFSLMAVESVEQLSRNSLSRELANKTREAICLCVVPTVGMNIWPLAGERAQAGAATVVPLYPIDVDAVASQKVAVDDLVQYKICRRLMLDKPDAGTQYDGRLLEEFLMACRESGAQGENLDAVLKGQRDDARKWIEHPLFSRIRRAVELGRSCLLVGPSSSGKSVLAFQVGRSFHLAGQMVHYINLGQLEGFPGGLYHTFYAGRENRTPTLLILDDLQSNPAAVRYLLAVAAAARRCSCNTPPAVLGVSWVDYAREAATWFEDCLPIAVRAQQIRPKLVSGYRAALSDADISRLVDRFGEDILLLRLSLDQSKEAGRRIGAADLAAYLWRTRTQATNVDDTEATRLVLVVGSLGRFDIPTPPSFLLRVAQSHEHTLHCLLRTGLLRQHGANVSLGHRSLSGLLVDWLARSGAWQSLDALKGPRSTTGVVLEYLLSLGSSLAVDSLRALRAKTGFKDRPRLNRRAAALVELYEAFNAVLERIEHQQQTDPRTPDLLPT